MADTDDSPESKLIDLMEALAKSLKASRNPAKLRCIWCGRLRVKFSAWEQRQAAGEYARLCSRCASRRLNNPYNALLDMRKIASQLAATLSIEGR